MVSAFLFRMKNLMLRKNELVLVAFMILAGCNNHSIEVDSLDANLETQKTETSGGEEPVITEGSLPEFVSPEIPSGDCLLPEYQSLCNESLYERIRMFLARVEIKGEQRVFHNGIVQDHGYSDVIYDYTLEENTKDVYPQISVDINLLEVKNKAYIRGALLSVFDTSGEVIPVKDIVCSFSGVSDISSDSLFQEDCLNSPLHFEVTNVSFSQLYQKNFELTVFFQEDELIRAKKMKFKIGSSRPEVLDSAHLWTAEAFVSEYHSSHPINFLENWVWWVISTKFKWDM
ncbi:MAG: hypothetical protein CL678_13275 [Bdellovibrionaceae bacterium]|nr:hypothetical protein [Pseudobdellovibrionaceae bacterium]|tara:strand:+ start:1251 stop:2111 length:861 start_codon:yes stop_codon:yes gene_type:complete